MTSLQLDECEDCERDGGIYNFKCAGCRRRFMEHEPCKIMKSIYLEYMIKRWGGVPDWKETANCGCKNLCVRRQAQKQPKKYDS